MFDLNKFENTKFIPREEEVPVPELKAFFGKEEKPVWIVRGLTGHEYGRIQEGADSSALLKKVLEGLSSGETDEMSNAILSMVGDNKETPKDIIRRLDMLVLGSVSPKLESKRQAVKLCDINGVLFYRITNKIMELTGKGKTMEGPMPCGEEKK